MKALSVVLLLSVLLPSSRGQSAPQVEAWMPTNTMALFCVRQAAQLRHQLLENPWREFWLDPAMDGFRQHLMTHVQREVFASIQARAKLDFREVWGWAEGPVAFAVVAPSPDAPALSGSSFLMVADAGSRIDQVREALEGRFVSTNANAAPSPLVPIQGMTFRQIRLDWPPFPRDLAQSSPAWMGFTNSWLVAGNNVDHLAGLVRQMQATTKPSLTQVPAFVRDYQASARDSSLYAWIDLRPLMRVLMKMADDSDANRDPDEAIPMPKRRKMLETSGLTGLETLTFALRESKAGTRVEFGLGVPASARRGLVKMGELAPGDASPPPDIRADTVSFRRVRLSFRRTWQAFERMMTDLFPAAAGVMDLLFETAGPEGHSGDLREELLQLLGDDVITCALPTPSHRSGDAVSIPGFTRLGSTNAAHLALSLKALTVLLPPPMSSVTSQSILGHTVYTLQLPVTSWSGGSSEGVRRVYFTDLPEAVVFTSDPPLLGVLLTTNQSTASSLSRLPGLDAAVAEVGGMGLGYFGYENLQATASLILHNLRTGTNTWERWLGLNPIPPAAQAPIHQLRSWLDFHRLPAADQVDHYFSFIVTTAGSDANRMFYRVFAPRPPRPPEPEAQPEPTPAPN